MKHIKSYSIFESNLFSPSYWDLDEISDIFQDFLDEGFDLGDVSVGSALSIAPKKWCNSHHDFGNWDVRKSSSFASLSIKLKSNSPKGERYDFSTLDVLDECIKHFESYYKIKINSIYTYGIPTKDYSSSGSYGTTLFNWFNSCQTIKDISKSNNLTELPIYSIDLTFKLGELSSIPNAQELYYK